MKWTAKLLMAAAGLALAGCVVVPTRHGAVVVPIPPPVVVAPAPVVVAPAPPPPPPGEVEVVPSPYPGDPAYIWAPGWWVYDAYGVRHWHRGYWHHR
jgi:hypothetical protein